MPYLQTSRDIGIYRNFSTTVLPPSGKFHSSATKLHQSAGLIILRTRVKPASLYLTYIGVGFSFFMSRSQPNINLLNRYHIPGRPYLGEWVGGTGDISHAVQRSCNHIFISKHIKFYEKMIIEESQNWNGKRKLMNLHWLHMVCIPTFR